LAPDCPKFDKSFGPTTMGKVLGIWFNTTDLTWRLSDEKISANLQSINEVTNLKSPTLMAIQSLMGHLDYISTKCSFMNTFKFNLNTILASLSKNMPATMDDKARKDLRIWRNFLNHPTKWIPICPEKDEPPLATISFTTDAAGFTEKSKWSSNISCGVLGTDEKTTQS
jgi:hypothetical protein